MFYTCKRKILLIEDDHEEAGFAIRALQQNNIQNEIIHIDNGQDALNYIFKNGEYFICKQFTAL